MKISVVNSFNCESVRFGGKRCEIEREVLLGARESNRIGGSILLV